MLSERARCVGSCHTSSGTSLSTALQGKQGVQGVLHKFGVVQALRTSSNLLETHHYRDSKECKVLSHEFRVVRLYRTSSLCIVTEATRHVVVRTFSIYTVTGKTRYAGCFCTSSGWFKHMEPHRTFSTHKLTERARCVGFCLMSSGWFDCIEPPPNLSQTPLYRDSRTSANLLKPHGFRESKV